MRPGGRHPGRAAGGRRHTVDELRVRSGPPDLLLRAEPLDAAQHHLVAPFGAAVVRAEDGAPLHGQRPPELRAVCHLILQELCNILLQLTAGDDGRSRSNGVARPSAICRKAIGGGLPH